MPSPILPTHYPPSPSPRSPALFSKSSYFPNFKDKQHPNTISTFRSRRFRLLFLSVLTFLLTLWVVLRFANPAAYSIHNINLWQSRNLVESQGAAMAAVDTELEDAVIDVDLHEWSQQAANDQIALMGDDEDEDVDKVTSTVPLSPETLKLDNVKAEIQNIIAEHKIVVFSKTYCPYSKNAKDILNRYPSHPFHVVEVDVRDDSALVKQALIDLTSRPTFPNVFVNGKSIGGSDEITDLDRNGKLEEILSA